MEADPQISTIEENPIEQTQFTDEEKEMVEQIGGSVFGIDGDFVPLDPDNSESSEEIFFETDGHIIACFLPGHTVYFDFWVSNGNDNPELINPGDWADAFVGQLESVMGGSFSFNDYSRKPGHYFARWQSPRFTFYDPAALSNKLVEIRSLIQDLMGGEE